MMGTGLPIHVTVLAFYLIDLFFSLAWVVYPDADTRREKQKELRESGFSIKLRKVGVAAYVPCKVRMGKCFIFTLIRHLIGSNDLFAKFEV